MPVEALHEPQIRDPAWQVRQFWIVALVVLLFPALVAVEFKPWALFEEENIKVTIGFLSDFLPPSLMGTF